MCRTQIAVHCGRRTVTAQRGAQVKIQEIFPSILSPTNLSKILKPDLRPDKKTTDLFCDNHIRWLFIFTDIGLSVRVVSREHSYLFIPNTIPLHQNITTVFNR